MSLPHTSASEVARTHAPVRAGRNQGGKWGMQAAQAGGYCGGDWNVAGDQGEHVTQAWSGRGQKWRRR